MTDFAQGDIIRISNSKYMFVIVSNNSFIRATGVFHVCPFVSGLPAGPVHIVGKGKKDATGTIPCEQIKLIDPEERNCSRVDSLPYETIMEVSDAIQGIFEYD